MSTSDTHDERPHTSEGSVAVRLDYVLKETGSNLVRNLTLTLASLLTVAIALAFVAVSFLIGTGINQSFLGLRADVQMFVYMNPSATDEQIDSVARSLEDNPQVDSVEFLDEVATFEEFQRLFEDQPEFVSAIKPEELPQSFRREAVEHRCRRRLRCRSRVRGHGGGVARRVRRGVRTTGAAFAHDAQQLGPHLRHRADLRVGAVDLQHDPNRCLRSPA
ncbi:MAG: permease-like cell division protein FtsX [Microthrixaceae bacterium]